METRSKKSYGFLKSLTFRLILLAVASGLGLWLGGDSRSVAAHNTATKQQNTGKSLNADAFRFDILLAKAEPAQKAASPAEGDCPTAEAARPAEVPQTPAAVIVAQSEPVPTVQAPMRASLELRGPVPARIPMPFRPVKAPRLPNVREVAGFQDTQARVQVILNGLPYVQVSEKRKLEHKVQCELKRASKEIKLLGLEEIMGPPAPPAPPEPVEVTVPGGGLDMSMDCDN